MHTQDYVKGTVSKIECFIFKIPFKASDDKGTDYYDVRNFRTCVIKFDFFQKYLIVIHFVQTQQFTFSVLLNYLDSDQNKQAATSKFKSNFKIQELCQNQIKS
jgi:hypothetical protein